MNLSNISKKIPVLQKGLSWKYCLVFWIPLLQAHCFMQYIRQNGLYIGSLILIGFYLMAEDSEALEM